MEITACERYAGFIHTGGRLACALLVLLGANFLERIEKLARERFWQSTTCGTRRPTGFSHLRSL